MEADSTQHKMLKAKKRRNSSTSVSSVSTSSNSSSNSRSISRDRSSSTSSSSSSSKDRRRKKKSNGTRRKRKKRRSSSGSESELDLTKTLLPISGYIKTKDIMLEQMFKSISRKKLKAMLPDILKTVPLNKLKKMCLDQLDVMSKKRIYRTLAGENPDAISSSGTDESTDDASKTISQLTPHKPDILQNIESIDQIFIVDKTNTTNDDGSVILNDNITNILNNDMIENLQLDVNSKEVNQDNLYESNISNSNIDPKNSDLEVNNISCDESIPSSLPDLESEPEDFYGPFHYSENNDSDANDVPYDSNDSTDNSSSSVITENNDKEDGLINLIKDNVETDDILSIQNSKKEYFDEYFSSDLNIEKISCNDSSDPNTDKFYSNNLSKTLNTEDGNFGKLDTPLVIENILNSNKYINLNNEAQNLHIALTNRCDHLPTSSNIFEDISNFKDEIKKDKFNDNANNEIQVEKTINNELNVQQIAYSDNFLNVESSDLFSSSDINAMIMKVDDKEFYDEEDEVKVDSTNDNDTNIAPTNPVSPNKINEHFFSNADIVTNTKGTILNDTNVKNLNECTSTNDNMSELEMLELEMRARAIKAMIKAQEDSKLINDNNRGIFFNSKNIKTNAYSSNYIVKDSGDAIENMPDTKQRRNSIKSRLGSVVSSVNTSNSNDYDSLNFNIHAKETETKSCGLLVSLGQDGEPRTVDIRVDKYDGDFDLAFLNAGRHVDLGKSDKNLNLEFPKSERYIEITSTSLRDVHQDYSFEDKISLLKGDD